MVGLVVAGAIFVTLAGAWRGVHGVVARNLKTSAVPTLDGLDFLRHTAEERELLEAVAARVAPFGWHVQLQMNGHEFPDRLERLQRLPCPLVVDHVGRFMPPGSTDDPAFGALCALLDGGRCWVKLSAPYESSKADAPRYGDVAPLARALVAAAPERMLWASNWPHPNQDTRYDEAAMLDLLLDWVDDEATRNRILTDNPAELYGF